MAGMKSLSTLALTCFGLVQASPLVRSNDPPSLINVAERQAFQPTGPFLGDFPDPSLLAVDNTWYAYSTSTANPNISINVATSSDLISWTRVTGDNGDVQDALPQVPGWVNLTTPAGVWAPDVAEWVPGTFSLLYSAYTVQDSRKHCIGVATGSSARGPFTPVGDQPLICPLDQGGAIDAAHFQDPETGDFYVAYKIDGGSTVPAPPGQICGNSNGAAQVSTPIQLQRISDPRTFALDGAPLTILDNNGAPDENDVEAPSILYVPNLAAPAPVQKRDIEYTTEVSVVTTTICPEESSASATASQSSISQTVTVSFSSSATPSPSGSASPAPSSSASPSASSSAPPSSTSSGAPAPSPSAPTNGTYILFYSPGCFADESYAVGYAVSTGGVAGPYVRRPDLLETGDSGLRSPGGLTAVGRDPAFRTAALNGGRGIAQAVYHAGIPAPNGTRSLYTADVVWDGQNVNLAAPTA